MLVRYEFTQGPAVEIEVSDEFGEVIIEIEKKQENRDRAETRRHSSMEHMSEDIHFQFVDKTQNVEEKVEQKILNERLHRAVSMLDEPDLRITTAYYFEDKTMAAIGQEIGMSAMGVSKRLKKIPKKIKKFLDLV